MLHEKTAASSCMMMRMPLPLPLLLPLPLPLACRGTHSVQPPSHDNDDAMSISLQTCGQQPPAHGGEIRDHLSLLLESMTYTYWILRSQQKHNEHRDAPAQKGPTTTTTSTTEIARRTNPIQHCTGAAAVLFHHAARTEPAFFPVF